MQDIRPNRIAPQGLTPAEQNLAKVIERYPPRFAAQQWQRPVPVLALGAFFPYAVGLLAAGGALLLTVEWFGGEQHLPHYLFVVSVCLTIKAAGSKAARVAGGLSALCFGGLLAPRYASLWELTTEPQLQHLVLTLAGILWCTTRGKPRFYRSRMRRIIASITTRSSSSSPSDGWLRRTRSTNTS